MDDPDARPCARRLQRRRRILTSSLTGFIESGQRLTQPAGRQWSQRELLDAAARAELRNTGWPIGLVIHSPGLAPIATPDSIEARLGRYSSSGKTEDFWSLRKDGSYYVWRLFEEDFEPPPFTSNAGHPDTAIWFDIRIWRVTEVILHSSTLYRELGIPPDEPYVLAVNHRGLEGREFYTSTPRRFISRGRICHSQESTWSREVSQDYVSSTLKGLVGEVVDNLFVLFDFAQVGQNVVDDIVEEFMGRRS